MITDKEQVLYMYPDAVTEITPNVCDPDGGMIVTLWSVPKDIGSITRPRYLLGTGINEAQAWRNASIGIEAALGEAINRITARQLMEDV